jgi:hypothetical protein
MTRLEVLAIAALLFLVGSGAAYVKGRADGKELCEAKVLAEDAKAAEAVAKAASATAAAIAAIKVTNVLVRQQVEREVRVEPVYRDCVHSPDGLRHVNDALAGRPSGPAGGDFLSPASAPK